jgi:hypothetical protein
VVVAAAAPPEPAPEPPLLEAAFEEQPASIDMAINAASPAESIFLLFITFPPCIINIFFSGIFRVPSQLYWWLPYW